MKLLTFWFEWLITMPKVSFSMKNRDFIITEMAIASDSLLQNLRLRRQEHSLMRVQKYEQIADKLISGELSGRIC